MAFRVLGQLEVWDGDRCLTMPSGRQRALLAYLVIHRDTVVATDRLVDELWPAPAPPTAAKIVRNLVSDLRKLIGEVDGATLSTESGGYRLRVAPEQIDAHRFESLSAEGRRLLADGDAARAAGVLREALDLWRGAPFTDLGGEAFIEPEVARLEELRLTTLEERIEADLVLGRHAGVVPELEAEIRREPLRERLRGQLMLALYRSNRQADALAVYRDARQMLVEELGLEPGRHLRELEAMILAQDPSLDLESTRSAEPSKSARLPRPTSSFIGRERDVASIERLVSDGARLVTLTGPGGSGKTRLAIQAASSLAAIFADGVVWTALADLRDAALVMPTLAQALGSREAPGAQIGEKELLLVLDNLEQVIDAAPGLADLVEACPRLVLLVTSRELLRVRGEVEFAVSPLESADAVLLFCQRAGLEPSGPIADLCRGLDNMPLALELAAGRTRALSPEQILARLSRRLDLFSGPRDADPRQQTLRATIEWSHELLTASEREQFARLAVFVGGCTLKAAEVVAGSDLDTLQSLAEKSLVRHSVERFSMLETIREYAAERLEMSGEADIIWERLADWLITLAESQGAPMFFDRQETALPLLELEHPNTRAVIGWALRVGRNDLVARLFGDYEEVWTALGHQLEAVAWIDAAVAGCGRLPPEDAVRALGAAAEVAELTGDPARAVPLYEQAVALASASEAVDPFWEPAALAQLSRISLSRGDLPGAHQLAERSLELRLARELPRARALAVLGEIALQSGELERARDLLEEALAAAEHRHAVNDASYLEALGEVARRGGDDVRAKGLYRRALEAATELGNHAVAADCLEGLALVARDRGDLRTAAQLWATGCSVRSAVRALPSRPREPGELADLVSEIEPPKTLDDATEYAVSLVDRAAASPRGSG